MKDAPILSHKYPDKPSVFQPENLVREARRQKAITELVIPKICILDPDGDIEEYVIQKYDAWYERCLRLPSGSHKLTHDHSANE